MAKRIRHNKYEFVVTIETTTFLDAAQRSRLASMIEETIAWGEWPEELRWKGGELAYKVLTEDEGTVIVEEV